MKLVKVVTGIIVLIAAATWAAWRFFPVQAYVLIDRIRHPIANSQPIQWAKGPAKPALGKRPPNVILIVADDLGFNDITANGPGGGVARGLVPTPNIDAIAAEGARFEPAYTANATCSPSRAALMTGRYPARFGFEFTAVPKALAYYASRPDPAWPLQPIYHSERTDQLPPYDEMGVPAGQITIAEALKPRGYHTIHIGKWHLGSATPMRPEAQGFDESLGFMEGASKYLDKNDPNVVNEPLAYDPVDRILWPALTATVQWNGGQRFRVDKYMTDYFSSEAVAAIEANRNRPFFLYLAYNAPHTPFQAKKGDYDALSAIKDHKTRVYGAMIRALDRGVGEVMAALKAQGIDDKTMVIFTSDNGGAWYAGLPEINRPYRGWKATFFEGGIRVPFFVRWPGTIPAGQRLAIPAHQVDVFATAVSAAGGAIPRDRVMDSINLLPFMTAHAAPPANRTLFWRSGGYRAVRDGQMKLQIADNPGRIWLFDLSVDPTERHNLAAQRPAEVRRLRALLDDQTRELPKPLWPALIEEPVRIDVPEDAPWRPDQEYVYWSN